MEIKIEAVNYPDISAYAVRGDDKINLSGRYEVTGEDLALELRNLLKRQAISAFADYDRQKERDRNRSQIQEDLKDLSGDFFSIPPPPRKPTISVSRTETETSVDVTAPENAVTIAVTAINNETSVVKISEKSETVTFDFLADVVHAIATDEIGLNSDRAEWQSAVPTNEKTS